ncbi:MAG: rhodanese-like domain-containing protein, partial [Chloroflexi bacterium]|nr:rhodanese-like domain-containing protein [Chloroflexota bacterium]
SSRGGGLGMNYAVETKINESTKTFPLPASNNSGLNSKEVIRIATNKWLKSKVQQPKIDAGPQNRTDYPFLTPKELFYWLHNEDPNNQPFVVSISEPEQYAKGHVPGSINISLNQLAKKESLQKLPPDKPVVIVSSDGMSGSQAMAILNILGYDARNMLFGMTGWTENENTAPGHFQRYKPGTREYKDI